MIIERIKITNIVGMTDIDWNFPQGPVLIPFSEISHHKLFFELILTLFYNQKDSDYLKGQNHSALVQVWMIGETSRLHISNEYIPKDDHWERQVTLTDENNQLVRLQEGMTLGNYFFKCELQAFLQGGVIQWPENDNLDQIIQRTRNLRQGGDEEISITKVRASIAGAIKRVRDQKESMDQVKAEYETLRTEWESAHRQQEDERLIQIEIKNLLEKLQILSDRINLTMNIQKRMELLSQNPDYRQLRRIQDEIHRLEERKQSVDASLMANSNEPCVEWGIIDNYREECAEWAHLQKKLDDLDSEIRIRSAQIVEAQGYLQLSGYQEFQEDEDEQLRRVLAEKETAEKNLRNLIIAKRALQKLEKLYSQENARLGNLAVMADVTERDIEKILQKEKKLEKWQNSKVGSLLDGTLEKRIGMKSIEKTLSLRLLDYYKSYQTSNYKEFTSKLERYLTQQNRIQKIRKQMERLQAKVNHESLLEKKVHSYHQRLNQAFGSVQASDFREWRKGWEDFKQKKEQLSSDLAEFNLRLGQQLILQEKLAACTEGLREKLKNWGIPTTNREEILEVVLRVAALLQEKNEIEREIITFSEKFQELLRDRDMEQLSRALEPLAELEREKCFSYEERQAEISNWSQERVELSQRIEVLKQRLSNNRRTSALSVLENKITDLKRQWTAYENLGHALEEAQVLLELTWQEWQSKYERTLNQEKQWVIEHTFSLTALRTGNEETQVLRNYFAYRMAIAQLALGSSTEVPLFFSVGNIKSEDQLFWEDVTNYLRKLTLSRQIILCTKDSRLIEKLSRHGWSSLKKGSNEIIQ